MAERIQIGDLAIVYLKAESDMMPGALGGALEFQGARFRALGAGMFDQLFPIRIPIKVLHASDPPIPFKPLINRINLTRNKVNYGACLRGQAARKLSEEDFDVLLIALKELQSTDESHSCSSA